MGPFRICKKTFPPRLLFFFFCLISARLSKESWLHQRTSRVWRKVTLSSRILSFYRTMAKWINDSPPFNRRTQRQQRHFETLWGHLTIRSIRRGALRFLPWRTGTSKSEPLKRFYPLQNNLAFSLFQAQSGKREQSFHVCSLRRFQSYFASDKALRIDDLEGALSLERTDILSIYSVRMCFNSTRCGAERV